MSTLKFVLTKLFSTFFHQDVWLYILGKGKAYTFCRSVTLGLVREEETLL